MTHAEHFDGWYGIVANVAETDSALRLGAKAWVIHAWTGGGYEKVTVWGMSRSGRNIEKWVPIWRLHNFRAVWIPDKVREAVSLLTVEGSQEAMNRLARSLDRHAAEQRVKRPDRFTGHQVAGVRDEPMNKNSEPKLAKPVPPERRVSIRQMAEDVMKRYPKLMAYLAKH